METDSSITFGSCIELVFGKLRSDANIKGGLVAWSEGYSDAEAEELLRLAQMAADIQELRMGGVDRTQVATWTADNKYAVYANHRYVERLDRAGTETRYVLIPARFLHQRLGDALAWFLHHGSIKPPGEYEIKTSLDPLNFTIHNPLARAVEAVQNVIGAFDQRFFFDLVAHLWQLCETSPQSLALLHAPVDPKLVADIALAMTLFLPLQLRSLVTVVHPTFATFGLVNNTPLRLNFCAKEHTNFSEVAVTAWCQTRTLVPQAPFNPVVERWHDYSKDHWGEFGPEKVIRHLLREAAPDLFPTGALPVVAAETHSKPVPEMKIPVVVELARAHSQERPAVHHPLPRDGAKIPTIPAVLSADEMDKCRESQALIKQALSRKEFNAVKLKEIAPQAAAMLLNGAEAARDVPNALQLFKECNADFKLYDGVLRRIEERNGRRSIETSYDLQGMRRWLNTTQKEKFIALYTQVYARDWNMVPETDEEKQIFRKLFP